MGENDNETGGGDYSNEGRNHADPTGTAAGNTQSAGGGWNGAGDVADAHIASTGEDYSLEGRTGQALGNISPGADISKESQAAFGWGGSAGAAAAPSTDVLGTFETVVKTVLGLFGLAAGGITGWSSAANLASMYRGGAYGKLGFGSAAPSTNVSSGSGAASARTDWEQRGGVGSAVIGWQGAVVNQPAAPRPAPAARPSDYLGFNTVQPSARIELIAPAGASSDSAASTNSTGLVGLAIVAGLLAIAS